MATKIVGIDVGTYSIKVAEIETSSKSYAWTAFTEYALSVDPNRDRTLEIVESLRKVTQLHDPATTRYVLGFPQDQASTRRKTFPFHERQKILKSLAFELEDEIPMDPDETIFDAKFLETEGPLSHVMAVACPKESIQARMALARDGAFEPEILGLEGFALANLFERWDLPPPALPSPVDHSSSVIEDDASTNTAASLHEPMVLPKSARAIVHMGHTRTLVLVYREGSLVALRSILWGGFEIAQSLAKTFSIPLNEGNKVLQTKSFILMNSAGASRDQQFLSQAVSTAVDVLARELKLTLLEIKSEFKVSFTQVDLFGGASLIQNLAPYLTQSLEIPVNLGHFSSALKQVRIEVSPHMESTAGVAVGLAIEGMRRPRNPAVNLRRGEFAKKNRSMEMAWEKWQHTLTIAGVAFLVLVVYAFLRDMIAASLVETTNESLITQAKNVKQSEPSLTSTNESGIRSFNKEQKEILKTRQALAKLDTYNSAMEILIKVSDKMPVEDSKRQKLELNVKKFLVDNDDVKIEGTVAKPTQVEDVRKALEQVARGRKVEAGTPSALLSGGGTPFAFNFKVNREN